ncbi:hypothetical protein BDR05DRAFT_995642 [Suillus weaverae]|nr:hypothetical protein BDR05DRAFT_995642 [Suillus weaverae]
MGDSGRWDGFDDIQIIGDDELPTITPVALDKLGTINSLLTPLDHFLLIQPLALYDQFSDQEYGPPLKSVGVTGPLPEPGGQLSQDLLLFDTSGLASIELGAQPFLTQHGTYSEGQTLSGCSARRDQRLPRSIVRNSQGKVKCTWPGCSRFVKKGNLTRHMNETHWRKIKAVCASCGKGFTRPYLRKNHICRVEM